jgi:hypothetical protein
MIHHNMNDDTESIRRARIVELNKGLTQDEKERLAALQAQYGRVWNKEQLSEDFEILGFMAPYVVVRCKTTGAKGSLEFTHSPRFYFNYVKD